VERYGRSKVPIHLGVRSSSRRPSQRTHGSAVPWSCQRSLLLILCRVATFVIDHARNVAAIDPPQAGRRMKSSASLAGGSPTRVPDMPRKNRSGLPYANPLLTCPHQRVSFPGPPPGPPRSQPFSKASRGVRWSWPHVGAFGILQRAFGSPRLFSFEESLTMAPQTSRRPPRGVP
jgi:hypothetical protein